MTNTILLAEDSPDDEFFFRGVLNSVGVTAPIEVVRDGNQAIAYLNGEGVYADRNLFPLPSALFLDLVMPRADGFQVLKWLKTQSAFDNMLVIVLTNYSEGRLLRDAYAMGADSFLFKPFTKADLESLMQHFPDGWTKSTTGPGVPVQR